MAETGRRRELLPAVGFNMALELTVRASVSFVYRILMGAVAGLPPTAISVNAAVAFGLTAALEVPMGLLADRIGPLRTIKLGCSSQALAAFSMFAAIALAPTHPGVMWLLLVLEGVFDALGNTLLSGAREAFYQDLAKSQDATFRERLLLLTERFSRYLPSIVVPITSCAAVAAHVAWGLGHVVILLLGVAWLALRQDYVRLGRDFAQPAASPRTHPTWAALGNAWRNLRDGSKRLKGAALAQTLGLFVYILVNSYLSIELLRNHTGPGLWAPLWMTMFYTAVFAVGRYARSYLLPSLAAKMSGDQLMFWGSTLIMVAGILAWGAFNIFTSDTLKLITVAVFLVAFDSAVGLLSRAATGVVLVGTAASTHATVLSLLNAATIVLQTLYSVALTTRGIGAPTASEIFGLVAAIGALIIVAGVRSPDA